MESWGSVLSGYKTGASDVESRDGFGLLLVGTCVYVYIEQEQGFKVRGKGGGALKNERVSGLALINAADGSSLRIVFSLGTLRDIHR